MHRIDGPGATATNKFTEGTPGAVEATMVTDDWANAVQEELAFAIESSGAALDKANNTQLAAAISALSGGAPFDNLLDNPGFTVRNRQYNPLATTVPHYFTDRWMVDPGDGDVLATVVNQSQSYGSNVPIGTRAITSIRTTVATTSSPVVLQQRALVGPVGVGNPFAELSQKPITVSFYSSLHQASVDASRDIVVRLRWHFGTGGAASADIIQDSAPVTILRDLPGEVMPRHTVNFTAPDLSGLSSGNTVSYLEVQFRHPVGGAFGATETHSYGLMKLQVGTQATAFVHRTDADEMIRCLRFYEQSKGEAINFGTPSANGIARAYELVSDGAAQTLGVPLSPKIAVNGLPTAPTLTWFAASNNAAGFVDIAGVPVAVTGTVGLGARSTGYPTFAAGTGTQLVEAGWAADFEIY